MQGRPTMKAIPIYRGSSGQRAQSSSSASYGWTARGPYTHRPGSVTGAVTIGPPQQKPKRSAQSSGSSLFWPEPADRGRETFVSNTRAPTHTSESRRDEYNAAWTEGRTDGESGTFIAEQDFWMRPVALARKYRNRLMNQNPDCSSWDQKLIDARTDGYEEGVTIYKSRAAKDCW